MSKEVNNTNSQNDVISTVTHSLCAFESLIRTEMPGQAVVYDEEVSYETGLKQFLSNSNYSGNHEQDPLPIFIYNRTVLIDSEYGLGKRAKNMTGCMRSGSGSLTYGATYGEYEIQFLYVSKNIEMAEKFEVVYNSDEGITGSKEMTVKMGELGDFKYFLTYQDLTSKEIAHENVYYKGIIGSIKVRGFYFTFRGTSGIIEQINSTIYACLPDNLKAEELGNNIVEP